jgi:ATP-dependent Lon protease
MEAVIPDRLPTLALRDLVFFPEMVLPLLVGRSRSVAALQEALEGSGHLLLLAQRDAGSDDPTAADLHRIGTVARVVQSTRLEDDTYRVVFEGVQRARVDRFLPGPGPFRTEITRLRYPVLKEETADTGFRAIVRRAERGFRDYVHAHPDLPSDLGVGLSEIQSPEGVADLVAGHLLISAVEKQALLESESLEVLFRDLLEILERELEILKIEDDLDREMRQKMDEDRAAPSDPEGARRHRLGMGRPGSAPGGRIAP